LGTGFYGSNDPTNSVKALAEGISGPKERLVTALHYTLHRLPVTSFYLRYIHVQQPPVIDVSWTAVW